MSVSCPKCYKPVVIEDVVIKSAHAVRKVQTCGKVVVEAKGRLIAATIEASGGVEVLGILEGNVTTPGRVVIGGKASWKGDCRAASLKVELGAVVSRGYFVIGGG
jgi:cytoskeletal protein CcmA (bactofilin family)